MFPQYCLSMGGDLISITTPGEQALISHYLTAMDLVADYWIGKNIRVYFLMIMF